MRIKIPIVEVFLSGVSVWWCFVLFYGAEEGTRRLPIFLEVLDRGSDYMWGVMFLTAAAIKIYGIATECPRWRKAGLIASMIMYGSICTGYILAENIVNTGTGVYFLLTVLAWWGFREVKENGEPTDT